MGSASQAVEGAENRENKDTQQAFAPEIDAGKTYFLRVFGDTKIKGAELLRDISADLPEGYSLEQYESELFDSGFLLTEDDYEGEIQEMQPYMRIINENGNNGAEKKLREKMTAALRAELLESRKRRKHYGDKEGVILKYLASTDVATLDELRGLGMPDRYVWGLSYKRLIESAGRAKYRISEDGLKALGKTGEEINIYRQNQVEGLKSRLGQSEPEKKNAPLPRKKAEKLAADGNRRQYSTGPTEKKAIVESTEQGNLRRNVGLPGLLRYFAEKGEDYRATRSELLSLFPLWLIYDAAEKGMIKAYKRRQSFQIMERGLEALAAETQDKKPRYASRPKAAPRNEKQTPDETRRSALYKAVLLPEFGRPDGRGGYAPPLEIPLADVMEAVKRYQHVRSFYPADIGHVLATDIAHLGIALVQKEEKDFGLQLLEKMMS